MTGYALNAQEVPGYRVSPADGHPLPELVDFRLTDNGRKAIFFVREGTSFYWKSLDLTCRGAGLYALNPAFQNATFTSTTRKIRYDDVDDMTYDSYIQEKYLVVCVSREMAQALSLTFWSEDLQDWPAPQEGLHSDSSSQPDTAAPDTDHANAAD